MKPLIALFGGERTAKVFQWKKEREQKSFWEARKSKLSNISFQNCMFQVIFVTHTVNMPFEIVRAVLKFAKRADWINIIQSQEMKMKVQTNVKVTEGNTSSLKIVRFEGE